MTKLNEYIPQDSKTVEAIYAEYKRSGDAEQPRGYLGASIIGHGCSRYLWYTFRSCCKPEFSGRMYRLFDTGDLEEKRFVSDLRSIGATVHDMDESGLQFSVSALGGHFSGHIDGCALNIPEAPKAWHVTEFKTHCNKSFAKLRKEGVQKAKPMHYAQMQVYMGLTGMTRALYLAVNKDTDELYSERVHFDKELFDSLMKKAESIITSNQPPERISSRPDYYECSYCDAKKICWGSEERAVPIPQRNCRQCCFGTAYMDGNAGWKCDKHKRGLSEADQSKACEDHLLLPGLVTFAEPTNSGESWIEFTTAKGEKFWHGSGANLLSTKELMSLSVSAVTNKSVTDAKELFGAVVEKCGKSILDRYPESDCRIVWQGDSRKLNEAWTKEYGKDISEEEVIDKERDTEYDAIEFRGGRVAITWQTPLLSPDYDA